MDENHHYLVEERELLTVEQQRTRLFDILMISDPTVHNGQTFGIGLALYLPELNYDNRHDPRWQPYFVAQPSSEIASFILDFSGLLAEEAEFFYSFFFEDMGRPIGVYFDDDIRLWDDVDESADDLLTPFNTQRTIRMGQRIVIEGAGIVMTSTTKRSYLVI